MASILILGSFLAGSLLSILLPLGLLIALVIWQGRAIVRVPRDPASGAVHAAAATDLEGQPGAGEGAPQSPQA
jgi:hypothetical protein